MTFIRFHDIIIIEKRGSMYGNKLGKDYIQGIGFVYYDSILQEEFADLDHERKFYILKRFAKASCKARYGYDRSANSKYRLDFQKRGVDVSNCAIHHEIDGRIYLIPKEVHKIAHYGYVALLKRSHIS